jgi:hypothetical protein
MPARKPPPPDEKPQFERFIETARRIGADETDEALDRAIEKIAPPKKSIVSRPDSKTRGH